MDIIQTESLTKVYGTGDTAVTALHRVNLAVKAGEFVAVMGPSGCGKSTLLHLIGGLDHPTEGRVLLEGQDLYALDDARLTELRRRRIGMVFQFYNLIPVLNAVENVALPLILDGAKPDIARARAADWLCRLGLDGRLSHRPDQLSGGQQQRVAIARALVTEPALILADEPTGNLDPETSEHILGFFAEINREGRTIAIVTHDMRAARTATRTLKLANGKILSGKPGNP